MRINRIARKTYAEGPGCRYCIWVQGCSHKCDDCFSKETWDYNGGKDVTIDEIKSDISSLLGEIRGITLLGGEPFDKDEELAEIAKFAKSNGLDVIAFSGYKHEELLKKKSVLLNYVDLLLDGKYVKDKQDFSRPLVGSSNQRFIYLSDCISEKEMKNYKNRFEIRTDKNGTIYFNGMGNTQKLKKLINSINGGKND